MFAHDWPGLRSCLTDDFVRVGPFPEHQFTDVDAYVAFLADLLPGLRDHAMEVTRTSTIGEVVYVEATEEFATPEGARSTRVCLVCELAPDGRLRAVEVFLRRP